MCNISVFNPGVMPKQDEFFNVCYNNWHSFGLIIKGETDKKKKRFEVVKQTPEKEIDPSEILELLEENKNFKRILHVRHNTAGATNMENCHPFEVYKDKNRQVWFMHNGTLYEYKSKKPSSVQPYPNQVQNMIDDPD